MPDAKTWQERFHGAARALISRARALSWQETLSASAGSPTRAGRIPELLGITMRRDEGRPATDTAGRR